MPLIITKGLGADGETPNNLLNTQGYGGLRICGCDDAFTAVAIGNSNIILDVTFNLPMGPLELQAADPANWIFTSSSPVPIIATGVAIYSSTKVRLNINEPKAGETYTLTFPATGLKASNGAIYNGVGSLSFVANAIPPIAAQAQSLDSRRLRVIFSEPVIEADALIASNYSILPSLAVHAVVKETESTYILTTNPQTPGTVYTLTVVNVRDTSQNPV